MTDLEISQAISLALKKHRDKTGATYADKELVSTLTECLKELLSK